MESMDSTGSKTVWNADDIIKQADSWSLAGDATLLNSIKHFAYNVLSKTEKFGEDIDNLLNKLDEVGLNLDISQNEFQSLRNTQFIENRVYEDDETLDSKVEEKVVEKVFTEEQEASIFDSVVMGMSILDNYYDAVEVSLSDSEEESEKSFVLRPKDIYSQRALPPIIGTDEWYKKWNLEDSSSGSESDKVSEIYSESDSEDNLPKDLLKGSETSSELDFISQTSESRPVANSTFNDSVKKLDSTTQSDDSGREDSMPIKSPLSNRTFAEQLAAKLDTVMSKDENQRTNSQQIHSDSVLSKEEINKQPIKPAQSNTYGDIGGDLFSSEPPPLFDPSEVRTGLFSGGQGLFDEHNDPLSWDSLTKATSIKQPDMNELLKDEKMNVPEKNSFLPKSSQVSKGLFDSEDSSDDDFFGIDKRKLGKTSILLPNNLPTVPLFDDEPPELQTIESDFIKKKTEEDSSDVFEHDGLKDILKNQQSENSKRKFVKKPNLFDDDDDDDAFHSRQIENDPISFRDDNLENTSPTKQSQSENKLSLFDDEFDDNMNAPSSKLKISLFDDDDDLFKDDFFSQVNPKKHTSDLFADLDNTKLLKNENFGNRKDINSNKHPLTLDDVKEHSNSLEIEKMEEVKQHDNTNISSEIDKLSIINNNDEHPKQKIKESENKKYNFENTSIVSSLEKEYEDLFENEKKIEQTLPSPETESTLFSNSYSEDYNDREGNVKTESKPEVNAPTIKLFDSTPPPDDDGDWDSKSDNFSFTEDFPPYQDQGNLERSSLFDNEPPSLDANESSGIVRDHSITRVDTDDSSFYPYASSSRRHSSDIFSDQQSQDSFFITKSRTDSVTVSSNLDIIQENSDDTSRESQNVPSSSDVADDVSSYDNFFDTRNTLSDDVFSYNNNSNNPSGIDRDQNLNAKQPLTTGRTEVDGEVNINKKIATTDDITKNEVKIPQSQNTTGSPGKLKHNLNINVNALMPGYVPPKTKEFMKSYSLDSSTEIENNGILKSNDNYRSTLSTEDLSNKNISKSVSFEKTETTEVLSSITKDRAKIPIKRRPSTRRGRQEAIRKSVIENLADHNNDSQNIEEKESASESISTIESPTENNKLTSEDNKDIQSSGNPSTSVIESMNDSKKLFGSDSESDDDYLFTVKKSERNQNNSDLIKNAPKKSLFEDSSSDDDLFKSANRGKRDKTGPSIGNRIIKKIIPQKTDNFQPSEDPLSDLLK